MAGAPRRLVKGGTRALHLLCSRDRSCGRARVIGRVEAGGPRRRRTAAGTGGRRRMAPTRDVAGGRERVAALFTSDATPGASYEEILVDDGSLLGATQTSPCAPALPARSARALRRDGPFCVLGGRRCRACLDFGDRRRMTRSRRASGTGARQQDGASSRAPADAAAPTDRACRSARGLDRRCRSLFLGGKRQVTARRVWRRGRRPSSAWSFAARGGVSPLTAALLQPLLAVSQRDARRRRVARARPSWRATVRRGGGCAAQAPRSRARTAEHWRWPLMATAGATAGVERRRVHGAAVRRLGARLGKARAEVWRASGERARALASDVEVERGAVLDGSDAGAARPRAGLRSPIAAVLGREPASAS